MVVVLNDLYLCVFVASLLAVVIISVILGSTILILLLTLLTYIARYDLTNSLAVSLKATRLYTSCAERTHLIKD